jgi:hypothetical protein
MSTSLYARAKTIPTSSFTPIGGALLQRKCACGGTPGPTGECEACRKKREAAMLQQAASHTAVANSVPPIVHEVMNSTGQSLDSATPASLASRFAHNFSGVRAQATEQSADKQYTRHPSLASGVPARTETPLYAPMPIPSNTVHCVQKWTPCSAPYSPGSWAAKVTYHCPRFMPPFILPGTTQTSYVTIPDEFIGVDSAGRDMYRCRPGFQVRLWTDIGDISAAALNRNILYPDQQSCHVGYRTILKRVLEVLFEPSGGGRPAGIRVNAPPPPPGIPCP